MRSAKWLMNIALLASLAIAPAWVAYVGQATAATFLFSSLVVVLLAINISGDRLEEFRIGPLTAKLREKIAEADKLTDDLKRTITLTLGVAVSAAMRTGRFADRNHLFQKRIVESVDAIVRDAKLSEIDKKEILSDFGHFTEIDVRRTLMGTSTHEKPSCEPLARSLRHRELEREKRPAVMRQLAEAYGPIPPELEEWLRDYEQIALKGTVRRPEVWFDQEAPSADGLIRQYAETGAARRPKTG